MSVVDALAREVGSVGQLLHTLKPKQWEQPTRCPPMNVRELAAHMLRGAPGLGGALYMRQNSSLMAST